MNDYRVVPVDVYKTMGNSTSSTAVQPQGQGSSVQGTEGATSAVTMPFNKSSAPEAEKSKDALPITNESNVSLKFQIDEDTHNITVYIIDRESNRVLRSIPPQELNKLKAGDLLQMLA